MLLDQLKNEVLRLNNKYWDEAKDFILLPPECCLCHEATVIPLDADVGVCVAAKEGVYIRVSACTYECGGTMVLMRIRRRENFPEKKCANRFQENFSKNQRWDM